MIRKWTVLFWKARKKFKLAWALFRDKRVPIWQKGILFLPLIYIFSPLNLLSFAIPIIGQIDDVMIILLSIELLERVVDKDILADHQPKLVQGRKP